MNMNSSVTLTIGDDVQIVVPDSLNLITPYVILEQGDWFEDEIRFVRKLLQPGNQVIDIGANYGVYTLSMARAVGSSGEVWAFEPATDTASYLADGIAANSFSNVRLMRCALSDRQGTANFSNNEFSETNALVHESSAAVAMEIVPLDTLDDCMDSNAWNRVEFVKMDAEGEEINIINGGARFFQSQSPLVQYEIKAGKSLNTELVESFSRLGYDSYRLIPGLDVLIRFEIADEVDGYLLNLFCCKRDTARKLLERGLLVESIPPDSDGVAEDGLVAKYGWRSTTVHFPYGERLATLWQETVDAGQSAEVERAIALYTASREPSLPMASRVGALRRSMSILITLCGVDDRNFRLASLARVARDFGSRVIAVNALDRLVNQIFQQGGMNLAEPFLVPCDRFELIVPDDAFRGWIISALMEELEVLAAYSSFYTGNQTQSRLAFLEQLGFFGNAMRRRLELMKHRYSQEGTNSRIPGELLIPQCV